MAYRDLRQYLKRLEAAGLLAHVAAEVDKDWEISAVARQTFRRIPQERRPALMFDHIKGHHIPLVVGVLGGSRAIYALAMECPIEQAQKRWAQATELPIEPRIVLDGPCQEEVYCDADAERVKLPVPVWTVGQDPGPYHTSPFVISKDPETGAQNVGVYRVQEKSARRLGIMIKPPRNMNHHIRKNDALGKPTDVAIVFGTDPVIGLAAVTPFPYGVDELAVVGGVRGEPVEVVRGKTVDLLVPATAEVVIEGHIPPGGREQEGPFGEYAGYMGTGGNHPYIEVSCITTRHKPIYQAFMSQMPPSESSCIKQIGRESMIFHHLRDTLGLPIKDVHLPESAGATGLLLISMAKQNHSQPLKAMWGAWSLHDVFGKITVVVDDDIDVRDHFQVEWAMSFRTQPASDVRLYDDTDALTLDPSQADYSVPNESPLRRRSSKVGIDATRKHDYPPLAVPPQEHLDRVAGQWDKYGIREVGQPI
ncbi:MAG TPA: UbiD family decarboxylase [Chloroflexota bacterium]|nr:UbiD family decarboxylase [Chloroflexota bacterium]